MELWPWIELLSIGVFQIKLPLYQTQPMKAVTTGLVMISTCQTSGFKIGVTALDDS